MCACACRKSKFIQQDAAPIKLHCNMFSLHKTRALAKSIDALIFPQLMLSSIGQLYFHPVKYWKYEPSMFLNPSPECYLKSLANLSTWVDGAVKLRFTASLEIYSINSSAVKITGHRQLCFTWRLAMNAQLQPLTPGVRCNHSLKRCVSSRRIRRISRQ